MKIRNDKSHGSILLELSMPPTYARYRLSPVAPASGKAVFMASTVAATGALTIAAWAAVPVKVIFRRNHEGT